MHSEAKYPIESKAQFSQVYYIYEYQVGYDSNMASKP